MTEITLLTGLACPSVHLKKKKLGKNESEEYSEALHSSGSEEVLNKWDQNQTVTTNTDRDTT